MRISITPPHIRNVAMIGTGWPDHVWALARPVTIIRPQDRGAVAVAPRSRVKTFANCVNGMVVRVPVTWGVGPVFGVFACEGEALCETLLGAVEVRKSRA